MSNYFYHSAWKVYYHEILEVCPSLTWSEAQKMLNDWIRNAGDAKDLRKYCGPCYRHDKLKKHIQQKDKRVKCPSSCPIRCPNHQQLTLFEQS